MVNISRQGDGSKVPQPKTTSSNKNKHTNIETPSGMFVYSGMYGTAVRALLKTSHTERAQYTSTVRSAKSVYISNEPFCYCTAGHGGTLNGSQLRVARKSAIRKESLIFQISMATSPGSALSIVDYAGTENGDARGKSCSEDIPGYSKTQTAPAHCSLDWHTALADYWLPVV